MVFLRRIQFFTTSLGFATSLVEALGSAAWLVQVIGSAASPLVRRTLNYPPLFEHRLKRLGHPPEQVYQRLLIAVFCELIRAHIAVTCLPFIPNFIPNGLPSTLFCYFPHEQEVQHRVG